MVLKMEFQEEAPHSTPDQNDKNASRITRARKKSIKAHCLWLGRVISAEGPPNQNK